MKKWNRVLWGAMLIALGVILALNELEVASIDLFFDGWWTLLIIVPSLIGLFTERDKTGSLIGVCIGVAFLLASRDVIQFDMVWKLLVPVIIVLVGVRLIVGGLLRRSDATAAQVPKSSGQAAKSYCAVFSGQEIRADGEVFTGANVTAVFGGIDLDLRGAVIEKDCEINVCAVFGGVDILLPDAVRVRTDVFSIFGGLDNKKRQPSSDTSLTVYVNGCCIFGGADIQ